jgi:hypothetical protein
VWDDPERATRMEVRVSANGVERIDKPVTITGEFPESLRIFEIDEGWEVLDDAVPFQVDFESNLTFLMKGTTESDANRYYRIYFGEGTEPEYEPLVTASEGVMHQGQESISVSTTGGVYHYHQKGGGFASLIDEEGKDWITYRPGNGSAGEFRGIPNIIHPEGGLHPGAETCETRLLADGPVMARIHSSCHDGAWEAEWDIYPSYAKLTVEKAAHPYWFLYEGTPGGELDVDGDYWAQADGERRPVSERWEGRIEKPRWVYFGDASLDRVLFLVHHEDDGTFDQFYQMEGNMTVFGFGRKLPCCEKSLERTPAEFTIGFAETAEHEAVTTAVNSAYQNLIVAKGGIQHRP